MAAPEFSALSRKSSNTSSAVLGSRLPVGSSAKISFGLLIRARAIATRCCSPPDNSPGKLYNLPPKPNFLHKSSDLSRACFFSSPEISKGIASFSWAVKSPNK